MDITYEKQVVDGLLVNVLRVGEFCYLRDIGDYGEHLWSECFHSPEEENDGLTCSHHALEADDVNELLTHVMEMAKDGSSDCSD